MLLQFTVSNFKSFDEPTNFSMRAGGDKDHPGHVTTRGKYSATKTAAIYGANAAGKSNLVLAMGFARDLVVRGRAYGQALDYSPFDLCEGARQKPSGFHWYFVHAGKVWSYGFEILRRRIVEEYLFVRDLKGGQEVNWFSRETDEKGKTDIKFGDSLTRGNKVLRGRLEGLKLNMAKRPEQPFLTLAIENSIEEFEPVYEWFSEVLTVVRAESVSEDLLVTSHNQTEFLEFLSGFVSGSDTGISRLVAEEADIPDEDKFIEGAPPHMREEVRELVAGLGENDTFTLHFGFIPVGVGRLPGGQLLALILTAEHECENGLKKRFPLTQESEGTQRLLHLLPFLHALKTQPKVVVIDELERRLHTKLTRRFVELALQSEVEGNQLIFTTHDTNLLDSMLLRRDEIHFARKKNGRTFLERLNQYNIRSDRDYEKAYELGRVGGGGPRLGFEMFGLMHEPQTEERELLEVAEELGEVNSVAAS